MVDGSSRDGNRPPAGRHVLEKIAGRDFSGLPDDCAAGTMGIMPPVSQKSAIRSILETDRTWSLYALGDLDAHHFEHCRWHVDEDLSALILLYGGFDPPVLFAIGDVGRVAALFEEIDLPGECDLHIPVDVLDVIKRRRRVRDEKSMWRMTLAAAAFRPVDATQPARLAVEDLPLLERLYADGTASGEAPDCFDAAMLARGLYYGVREGAELVAAAGTHLLSQTESVAGIGNVYTRRDRRGRGLGAATTTAVAAELLHAGIRTIGLSVEQTNAGAIRVYERLGFTRHCAFCEGVAVRR